MCSRPAAKNTYGTGCFLLRTPAQPVASRHRLLSTVADVAGQTAYALEGASSSGARSSVDPRRLGLIRESQEIEALAASVPDSGGVFFAPARRPRAPLDPHARGATVGLTRGTNAGHVARAAIEAIAYQVSDLLAAVGADSGIPLHELRVDGGAAANDALLQFQADLLGVPVVRPEVIETTALGAAYLAGLAVGFWESPEALASHWRAARRFEPAIGRPEAERRTPAGGRRSSARALDSRGARMNRDAMLAARGARESEPWDLVVIGGGATGSRDRPRRGLARIPELLLERSDLGKARRAGAPSSCTAACATSSGETSGW